MRRRVYRTVGPSPVDFTVGQLDRLIRIVGALLLVILSPRSIFALTYSHAGKQRDACGDGDAGLDFL
jgi:hypothetical protein